MHPGRRARPAAPLHLTQGEVFGPLAALWPDRLDRVYSVATGPAILVPPEGPEDRPPLVVPADLPTC